MDHWYGYSYKWNKDQLDAVRVYRKGKDDTIRVYPDGKSKPYVWKKWTFPGTSQCNQCHRIDNSDTVQGRAVLGFFAAQLNRAHPDSAGINQLEYFFRKGLLTGAKPLNWNAADVPKWAPIDDNTASIDLRARSYIAANCSGCHGRRGMANSAVMGVTLDYDFHDMVSQMEFRHRFVTWPFGLDTLEPKVYPKTDLVANPKGSDTLTILPALVVPGYPNKSVVLFRQISRNTVNTLPLNWDPDHNQMPPLGSFEVNVPATNLIAQWITAMTPIIAPNVASIRSGGIVRTLLKSPSIEGGMLRLPPELDGPGNVVVTMTGISGRTLKLRQVGRGVYAIPSGLSAGVYQIGVGGKTFTRYLF